jgi:7,8-dihydropterin-6-yl-methyl-4-(beta-D-ribofuranosyl)aminobenzene 5'-phosphate synthase
MELKMRFKFSLGHLIVVLGFVLVMGCATTTKLWSDSPPEARITILYDAFGKPLGMKYDWGYAALIEYGGKRILFDTGDNPEILKRNAKIKGVDLSELDFVVLSHRHGDHIGGMSYLLEVNPEVKIYAPKESFGVFGYSLPGTFFRKEEGLTPYFRYYFGQPPATMKFGSAWPQANFELIEETKEIAPDIHLISLVSDKPGTQELHELSLVINTPDGLVLIVGCSHPGIEKIVEAAASINKHIHLVAGGFHLLVAKDPEIEKVTTSLHDTWKVDYLAPGHCTGEPAFLALRRAFGDRYIYAGLGSQITLGAVPHLVVDE